jgi:predicted nucleotide-binding protein
MARRTTSSEPPPTTILTISKIDFKERLTKRMTDGEELFSRTIKTNQELETLDNDYSLWNDYNFEMLKQVFNNPRNEYLESYGHSGYTFMGDQMGEIPNDPVKSKKNLIEYKLKNLKGLLSKSELLKTTVADTDRPTITKTKNLSMTEVFIVHGHDELAKTKAARFIEKLGLKPIIIHEQINSGKTIIEKIEEFSNVGFGVVLYTPCDTGSKKGDESNSKDRARQNVVFEHGYLIGKIGRENVSALVKGNIEVPNDISGVVYVKMDDDDSWQLKIAKELRNSGYNIDLNRL